MQLTSIILGFALSQLPTAATAQKCTTQLDAFIEKQSKISIAGVLANIGPDGEEAQGAAPGVVVASPSRQDPDCKLLCPSL